MRRLRIAFRVCLFLLFGLFLTYVLPQHDIVQINDTDTRRTDFGTWNQYFYAQADSGSATLANRDVLYIFSDKRKTFLFGLIKRDAVGPSVYRNEDTGWLWPPYFKFDSSNLQAQASSQARRGDNGEGGNWSIVTHYGWRIPFLSIFPNAVAIEPAEGPDQRIIPWFNIGFFIFLAFAFGMVRAMWRQFRERSVDPLLDSAGDQYDEISAGVSERRSRMGRWLDTWRKKDNRKH